MLLWRNFPHVINPYWNPKPCQFKSCGHHFPFSTFIFSVSIVLSECCPVDLSTSVLYGSFVSHLPRVFESTPDMPETLFHSLMSVGKQRVYPVLLTRVWGYLGPAICPSHTLFCCGTVRFNKHVPFLCIYTNRSNSLLSFHTMSHFWIPVFR